MIKRILDIGLSLLLLIICFPILLIISLLIWIETGSNPIFIQTRGITLNEQFKLYKFRTLKKGKTCLIENIFYKNELSERVTIIGKFLRKTGLDEFPQLLNVIKGDMSLIGPRPLSLDDLSLLKDYAPQFYNRRTKLKSKPGISGVWQIYGDRNLGVENLLMLDELYEKKKSIPTDVKLVFKTIPLVLTAKHSDSIVLAKNEYFRQLISEST